jgi:spore coat protein U-like protein
MLKKSLVMRVAAPGIAAGAVLVALIGVPTAAQAATATANLSVSATVINNCVISTAALAFGNYDPVAANAAANLDGTGTVTIACTKGTTATIGLGLGANASGTTRRMTDGSGNFLTYEMYQEVGHSTVWNTGAGLLSPAAAPSKAARNFTVYGAVTSNQDITAGSYTDTVVATVNF